MTGHYLMFNRNCGEALKTYEEAFAGKILEMQRYRDMPPNPDFPIMEEDKDLVLHACLELDGEMIMCADSTRVSSGDNMYITITTADEVYVKKAWNILSEGAEIYMELTPSFFAVLHGSLRDKYGVNWMFSVRKE